MKKLINILKNTANRILHTAYCLLKDCLLKNCLLLTIILIFSQPATAQIYPVQVTPQLIPPYSLKLSDYATTQSEKLIVNILMTDINEANRQLRFRFSITGNGLQVQSNDMVMGANPIFVDGGIPLRLTNLDLRPYFELQNLSGITPQQYNSPLPNGMYQFCFEVFDWLTGQRLSRKHCFPAYLIINDPPFLNIPSNGDLVEVQNPQNILFNWTPRHLNAMGVQYEFELREIWDTQIDPQAAFLATPNLYRTTTINNTLLYGPGETPLLENKTYAWRIRAIAGDGISEASIFKNNGYSEIHYFTYTADCKAPQFPLAKSKSTRSEEITWQLDINYVKFRVQYRKKSARDAVWFEVNSQNPYTTLYNLEAATTYEYRVGGQCTQTINRTEPRFSYTAIQEFTTPIKNEDAAYNCGIVPEINITNREPITNLAVNEVFTAGDFPVTIKQIDGGHGVYSGVGYIVVPYLADTKIAVEFNNIRINTDYQLYQGTLYTTYDASWGNVDDVQDEIDAVVEISQAIGELISELFEQRKEKLLELQQLQEDLANAVITQEEFDKEAGELVLADQKDINYYTGQIKNNVLNSPYATEKQKEEVKNLGPTALADNNDLSNADIQAISEQDAIKKANMQEMEEQIAQQEKEVKDYLFSILMALKAMDGDAFVKCKQCDKVKDGSTGFDGEVTYAVAPLGGKTLKCLLGTLAETGLPEITRFTQETFTEEQKQVFEREFATLTDLVEIDKKEQFLVVSPKNDVLRECTTPLTFPDGYCDKEPNDEVTEEEKSYLASELQKCLQTTPTTDIANTVTFTSEEVIDYDGLKQQLQKQLGNTFYNEVKLAVHVTRNGNTETLLSNGLANANEAEITLHVDVNEIDKTVSIGTIVSDNYLNHYVSKLQEEAKRRGIDVDVEELRQQVLLDLQEKQTMGWFADLAQKTKSLFNEKVGTFLEALQASQKIVKNVWDEGTINTSTWHSKDSDYTKWPDYAQFHPLIGGGTDGVIDEIVGIPIAIKGVYGIITDPQQREALKGMLTKEGFSKLIDGIAQGAKDTYNDNDKLQHFGAQTTISVASAITGVGIFTKGGELAGTLQQLTDKMGDLTGYPKLTRFLDDVKKQDWYDEAFKTFQKQFDELIAQIPISPKALDNMANHTGIENFKKLIQKLHKLKDIDGIEKVIQDLGTEFYPKFKGAKFVIDYITDKGDSYIKRILRFESPVELDLGDGLTKLRKYDAELIDGTKLEFKDWSAWKHWSDTSFKRQFIPDLADGDFTKLGQKKYIFKGNDNITKASLKKNILKSLKKADGNAVDELEDLFNKNQSFKNKVAEWLDVEGDVGGKDFLNWLDKEDNFNKIFEIVE